MLYDHTSELAIRAALYLALQPAGKRSTVQQIALATGLPKPYLAKIARRLIRAGLVRAFRGPGGGLELARPPRAITLWTVVQAMDGATESGDCALGLSNCSAETPCPLHARWFRLRNQIRRLLEDTTLARLRENVAVRAGAFILTRSQTGRSARRV